MTKLFSIDVPIFATAYIKADTAEDALNLANAELRDRGIEFSNRYQQLDDNICMDGAPFESLFDNDEEIALSPAMSFSDGKLGIAQIDGCREVEVELEAEAEEESWTDEPTHVPGLTAALAPKGDAS
jgi:hypothetical protein